MIHGEAVEEKVHVAKGRDRPVCKETTKIE